MGPVCLYKWRDTSKNHKAHYNMRNYVNFKPMPCCISDMSSFFLLFACSVPETCVACVLVAGGGEFSLQRAFYWTKICVVQDVIHFFTVRKFSYSNCISHKLIYHYLGMHKKFPKMASKLTCIGKNSLILMSLI